MTQELVLHSITVVYAACNVVRLLFYAPQLLAVARDCFGAYAISLSTWTRSLRASVTHPGACAHIVDRRSVRYSPNLEELA